MTPHDRLAHARAAARLLLRWFRLESTALVDVEAIAHGMGVRVVEAPLTGALAQLIVSGTSARILLSPHAADLARRRATIAHELGHYVLRHPSATADELGGEVTADRIPVDPDTRDLEAEADCFARELLVPPATVDAL
jgi:Zn-dependent peptidase ImmA (M78 family)